MAKRLIPHCDTTAVYQRILDCCETNHLPDYMIQQSKDFRDGLWKTYLNILKSISVSFEAKTVVDLGCKYGHVLPLFLFLGAHKAIGIDVEPTYMRSSSYVLGSLYPDKVEFYLSDGGIIPVRSNSVDIVFANEVISHINPIYLDVVYSEISRVMKIGGTIFISDGNNGANPIVQKKLPILWELWENGPDGAKTDRDIVVKSYLALRKEIIGSRYSELSDDEVHFLALNTSGLFGERLLKVIDNYLEKGELVLRPYRKGIFPTNPIDSGVVMERSFHPLQVVMALSNYGIQSHCLYPEILFFKGRKWKGKLYAIYILIRVWLLNLIKPGYKYAFSEGFQVIGVKEH